MKWEFSMWKGVSMDDNARLKLANEVTDESEYLLLNGRFDKAIEKANEALEAYPEHPRAYKCMGLARFFQGDSDSALELLEKACSLNPEYASGWFNLACVYARNGKRNKMLKALEEAILWGYRHHLVDYREKALRDADFQQYKDDASFQALCNPVPDDIKLVYMYIREWDYDGAISKGIELLEKPDLSDRLAVIDAIAHSAGIAVDDLEEHGDANLESWLGDSIDYYKDLAEKYSRMVTELREKGEESRVFDYFTGYVYKNENVEPPTIEELLKVKT
ncbi:MAG: tetratricopeptide repeat protein [Candidatus Aegiribacteria sp.]|nr:tetratricopeptide repeat protein [Candidatus Aegiribacteria sp.]